MGFWDTLSSLADAVEEYYQEKSIEDICNSINKRGATADLNVAALMLQVSKMSNRDLIDYYNEYSEYAVQDAAKIFAQELKRRGYL